MRWMALSSLALWMAACGSPPAAHFEPPPASDAGSGTVGIVTDAGTPDAGADAGGADAGADAGPPDAGVDAGTPDAGVDAGTPDAGLPDAGAPGPPGGGDWNQYRYDQRGGSVNPATFAASEVANLTQLWTKDLGDQGASYIYTQAMIAGDMVIYTTAASGKVEARDANPGELRWPALTLNAPITTACGGVKKPGFWAAAAVSGEVIYVASPDGNVYALHKGDGTTIWSAKVADPSAAGHGEFIQSSPAVSTALGKLYVGVASSAHCDPVAGRIASVDLATGAVQSAGTVGPGQQGASVWSSIAVAEDEDRLYVTTGNRIGPASATPYSQAFLAVDPHSLAVLDHWQNPTPLENSDFGSSPALGEAAGLKLLAATNKDGFLYVLRRDALTQGPLWSSQIAVIDKAQPTVGGDPTAGWGSISTPAFAHGRLYAAGGRTPQDEPGSVIAFEPATGKQLWKHPTAGFVLAPLALAGEIIAVASNSPDGKSTLELLDAGTGAVLRSFSSHGQPGDPGAVATYGAPSIGRGLILWSDAYGHATAFAAPDYRH